MKFLPTDLPGVVLIEPTVFEDDRGFFMESWHSGKFHEAGIEADFVQDNHSHSRRGTLRGLHLQRGDSAQGKLLRVVSGEVFDVAVDVRVGSPHFGKWYGVTLSAENGRMLWVPPDFAHGFLVTSERADVLYKCTRLYDKEAELGVAWNDPNIGVSWPLSEPVLSEKDAVAPRLEEVMDLLPAFHR